jgi:hypothetical protein
MAVLLIPAVILFGISMVLLCLGIMGAILTVALQVFAGVLWVAIKIMERRSASGGPFGPPSEPEILIVIEDDERPMRDVAPRKSTRRLKATAQR